MTQEILPHAASLLCPPTFQRRTVSSLHPHIAVERSPTAMSPVPQLQCRSLGHIPLPTRMPTLSVHRLQAHLQRPHRYLTAPKQAAAVILDSCDLSVMPRLFVPTHCEGGGYSYPV